MTALMLAPQTKSAQPVELKPRWVAFHGAPGGPHFQPILTVDLDGDGRDETISVTTVPRAGISGSTGFVVVGQSPIGELGLEQVFYLPQQPLGVQVRRSPDGDRLLVSGWFDYVDGQSRQTLFVLGGRPLRMIHAAPAALYSSPLLVADLDADGDDEIVSSTLFDDTVVASDLVSGEVAWSRPKDSRIIWNAITAQLDGDAALEVVTSGDSIQVIDGATGAREWNFPDAFNYVAEGRFGGSPALQMFAVERSRGVFLQAAPYSPVSQITFSTDWMVPMVGNFDADIDDEIALQIRSSVEFFGPEGTFRAPLSLAPSTLYGMASSHLDGDEDPDFAVIRLQPGAREVELAIVDSVDGETAVVVPFVRSDPGAIVVGDLAGEGEVEVAVLQAGMFHTDPATIRVHGMDDGALRREGLLNRNRIAEGAAALHAAQLDTDPALEVVVAIASNGGDGYAAIDLSDFGEQWISDDDPSSSITPVHSSHVADVDNDGSLEVVVLTGPFDASIVVLDAQSGAVEWESVAVSVTGVASLQVFQADDDAAIELGLWSGTDLFVFDGETRLLDWSIEAGDVDAHVKVFRDDAVCRVVVHRSDGLVGDHQTRVASYDCRGDLIESFDLPDPDYAVLEMFDSGNVLVGIRRDEINALDWRVRSETPLTENLGPQAGAFGGGMTVWSRDGRHATLLVNNDGALRRFDIEMTQLLRDGFEGTARR